MCGILLIYYLLVKINEVFRYVNIGKFWKYYIKKEYCESNYLEKILIYDCMYM